MTLLAADPRVPRRDALLRPETMAGVLSQRLHAGVPVDACERMYVKYRVGDSVRVVYRYRVGEQTTFAAARSGRSDGVPAPEVDAALYPSRTTASSKPCPGSPAAWSPGPPSSPRPRSCDGAYAKVQRGDGERRGLRALADQDTVRVPRILADDDGVLTIEALPGRQPGPARARQDPPRPPQPKEGQSLFRFDHEPGPTRGDHPPIRRGQGRRGEHKEGQSLFIFLAARSGAARDGRGGHRGGAARRRRCGAAAAWSGSGSRRETEPVTIHGDANLGNAVLLDDGRVALLDLEHSRSGRPRPTWGRSSPTRS